MFDFKYNIDLTGKIVQFLTPNDILKETDLIRLLWTDIGDLTFFPDDIDVNKYHLEKM